MRNTILGVTEGRENSKLNIMAHRLFSSVQNVRKIMHKLEKNVNKLYFDFITKFEL